VAALSEIEKLEARWAENPDGRYFAPLADAYRKAGRVDDAIQVVTQGLIKHPDYLSAHIVMGRCFLEKKDDSGARGAFDKVLSLDSENIIALKSLAEIAERTGETDAARRWLQRLLVVDQMNTEAADDLERLGGAFPDEGEAVEAGAVAAEATSAHISFADLSAPDEPAPLPEPVAEAGVESFSAPTESAPAIDMPVVPRTLERPAVRFLFPQPAPEPVSMVAPEPVAPAPMADLEPVAFEPPPPEAVPEAPADIMPFDEGLAWGAGERTSRSINAEDIAEAEAHHEATASAIHFLGGAAEAPTLEMAPVTVPPMADEIVAPPLPPESEPAPVAQAEAPPPAGLTLIMPEDVTPAEEMRRPSSKQLHQVSREAEAPEAEAPAEPLVTETMGDLYLRQGLKDQASDVYRRLLAQRPGDTGLTAKLAAIESPPAMSAAALGGEAVGAWLQRIARSQLPNSAATPPLPPPQSPEAGPTPMEQAFDAPEPESEAEAPSGASQPAAAASDEAPAGNPARPATDQFSLDQIFGAGGQAAPGAPPPPAPHAMGSSFDDFFGAAPTAETVRPRESASGNRQSEDDLSAFNAWLHGLKR
jgi:hypothetical protein